MSFSMGPSSSMNQGLMLLCAWALYQWMVTMFRYWLFCLQGGRQVG
jgi:hypothetical protein